MNKERKYKTTLIVRLIVKCLYNKNKQKGFKNFFEKHRVLQEFLRSAYSKSHLLEWKHFDSICEFVMVRKVEIVVAVVADDELALEHAPLPLAIAFSSSVSRSGFRIERQSIPSMPEIQRMYSTTAKPGVKNLKQNRAKIQY